MSLPTLRHSRPVAFPRRSATIPRGARPAASPASSSGGGFLAVLTAWLLLFGSLVIMPVAMLINGVEPEAVAGWMMMIVVAMAWTWLNEWWERRRWLRRHRKPKTENYPAGAAFREKWGTEERHEEPEKTAPEPAQRSFWRWPARGWVGSSQKRAKSRRKSRSRCRATWHSRGTIRTSLNPAHTQRSMR
jgi:hypothetical protein